MGDTPVIFEPASTTVWVAPDTTLLEAAHRAGVGIEATCAGRGTCGACGVRVVEGELSQPDPIELRVLGPDPGAIRLACRARVVGPVTVKPLLRSTTVAAELQAGAPGGGPVVVGVDLGTTSVVAAAVEESTGREVGRATTSNDQRSYGADVVSRLAAAENGEAHALQLAAVRSIERVVEAALGDSDVTVERVAVAANTAMAALLLGLPVRSLAAAPFAAPGPWPKRADLPNLSGRLRDAEWFVIAPLGAFVGGDVVAGLVATGLAHGAKPALLIDVGTNAEVALATHSTMLAASAPAGPAFEGHGIGCAGPATDGGVTSVTHGPGDTVVLRTIGDLPGVWFTGSGLLSATALLRRSGHLDETGLLIAEGPFYSRFSRDESGVLQVEFGDSIVLTQLDLRAVQLAVSAIRVAVASVLEAADVPGDALERVEVAGAFGAAIDPADLVELGIVPQAAEGVIGFAHNTSLAGAVSLARCAAIDRNRSIREVIGSTTVIDLARRSGFNEALVAAMRFEPT